MSSNAPSHAAVLDGLRRATYRQVVRHRHEPIFDTLVRLHFIVWTRQPPRLSRQDTATNVYTAHAPVDIAELTTTGRAALDWLVALERSAQWAAFCALPYGSRPPISP